MLIFRKVQKKDIQEILDIYNHYINCGSANFEEKNLSLSQFIRIYKDTLKSKIPFIVCSDKEKIVGFTYLNKFRNKSGYRFAYENSIYVRERHTNQGIGGKLLKELIKLSINNSNIKTIIAVIGGDNSEGSIAIHKKNGFSIIGKLKKVGFKNNKWLDSIYMQRVFNGKN